MNETDTPDEFPFYLVVQLRSKDTFKQIDYRTIECESLSENIDEIEEMINEAEEVWHGKN